MDADQQPGDETGVEVTVEASEPEGDSGRGDLWNTPRADLRGFARTAEARALTDAVFTAIEAAETGRTYARGAAQATKLERAVGAFLGDLLAARMAPKADGWASRALAKKQFSRQPVSHAHFMPVRKGMEALGLIETEPGFRTYGPSFNDPNKLEHRGGRVTRYRATEKLTAMAEAHGVSRAEALAHFSVGTPEDPIVLKTHKARHYAENYEEGGDSMEITPSPQVGKLRADVERLNAFLDQRVIRGGVHRGYERIFSNGDVRGFAWDQGGRLYSVGGGYQRMDEDARRRMTIDGSPLCEIDVHASFLTIAHGLSHEPLSIGPDQDLYVLEGLPPLALAGVSEEASRKALRTAVKLYAAQMWGAKKHPARWSKDAQKAFRKAAGLRAAKASMQHVVPIEAVRDALLDKYPLLRRWNTQPIGWATLMWIESSAVLDTMLMLIDDGAVPSLAVHDALLVPVDHCDKAVRMLQANYEARCGVVPRITIDGPL